MSARKPPSNLKRRRNSPKTPIILSILLGGLFVGLKWVKTVQSAHEHHRLEVQEHTLVEKIDQLKIDILSQQSRIKELTVRPRVDEELGKHSVRMVDMVKSSVIVLEAKAAPAAETLATVTP
jgi:hypothetical protein